MIVQNNILGLNAQRQTQLNNQKLQSSLAKLASGLRINSAGDDAAGLAISERMRAQMSGLDRSVMNAQDGSSLLRTADGALTEVHGMLNRLADLAGQAANGILDNDQRQSIQNEATAIMQEMDRIAEATTFNGTKVLDGSLTGSDALNLQVSDEAGAQISVEVQDMSTQGLGLGALSLDTQQGAMDAVDTIRSAIETVSTTRGSLGALSNRLDATISNSQVANENIMAAESRVRDADMAKLMMEFTKQKVLSQAGTAMMAHSNMNSQQVLQLLR